MEYAYNSGAVSLLDLLLASSQFWFQCPHAYISPNHLSCESWSRLDWYRASVEVDDGLTNRTVGLYVSYRSVWSRVLAGQYRQWYVLTITWVLHYLMVCCDDWLRNMNAACVDGVADIREVLNTYLTERHRSPCARPVILVNYASIFMDVGRT